MIDWIIDFPNSTRVDRVIHKKLIYEKAGATARLQRLFVEQIDQIRWMYKMASNTTNLSETKMVKEIQVIDLSAKTQDISSDVLVAIDNSIPSPILFRIQSDDKIKYTACYKRPNLADISKWVTSGYYSSDWINANASHEVLPVATNLEALYSKILISLIPIAARQGEALEATVERADLVARLKRESERLSKQLERERQFNRKVELNQELRKITMDIEAAIA
jgi:hypothetical protein